MRQIGHKVSRSLRGRSTSPDHDAGGLKLPGLHCSIRVRAHCCSAVAAEWSKTWVGEKQNGEDLETTTHGRLVRDGRGLLLLLLVCTLCLRQSLLLRLSLRLRLLLLLDAISLAEGRVGRMRGGDGGGGRGGVMAGDLGTVYGGHGRC